MKKYIEYICTYCGNKDSRWDDNGMPNPGVCQKRGRKKDGSVQPHSWKKNRVIHER